MNAITKRLTLWAKYLQVMNAVGIRPFRYSNTVTITNTPLIKLIIINSSERDPNRIDRIKTVDALGLERNYNTMAEFEDAFAKTFNHLRNGIDADFEKLLTKDVKVKFDVDIAESANDVFKHINTIEVLSPERFVLLPGATTDIECPFHIELPDDVIGVFYPKRSLRDFKFELRAPLLHAEFNGRPKIMITNKSDSTIEVNKFDAIAQIQLINTSVLNINIDNGN